MSEPAWWSVVGDRLGVSSGSLAGLRREMAGAGIWNDELLAYLRRLRGQARTAVVSNAWPHVRAGLRETCLEDVVAEVVLSCEVGWARPGPRICLLALGRLGVVPGDALLADDAAGHLAAARLAGLAGRLRLASAGTITQIGCFLAGRALPGRGGRAVAVQDFGFVRVPCGGGAVRVQDQGPAPPVDDNLMVKPAK